MQSDMSFMVEHEAEGMRLDRLLTQRFEGTSRSLARMALDAGAVRLNGRVAPRGKKAAAGDHIQIEVLWECSDRIILPDADAPLSLRHVDETLVVADKPAREPTHPLRPGERGTLANALAARYPEIIAVGDDPLMGGLAHRLDTDTSGLVLAARTTETYRALRALFAARTVHKGYLALVAGRIDEPASLIHDLSHDPSQRGRMRAEQPDSTGKRKRERRMRALCAYRPLWTRDAFSLLYVTLFTGVTHQIRCQLAATGHPIAGDALYGGPTLDGLDRQFLHATALALPHPAQGRELSVASPLPQELIAVLEKIGGIEQLSGEWQP